MLLESSPSQISGIALRTSFTGTSALLDAFALCTCMHRQPSAPELNGGECRYCGAMLSGYVFRFENPATVLCLQKPESEPLRAIDNLFGRDCYDSWYKALSRRSTFQNAPFVSSCVYLIAVFMTAIALALSTLFHSWWGLAVTLFLCVSF